MIIATVHWRFDKLGELCSLSHVANYFDPTDMKNGMISPARNYSMDGQMIKIALIFQTVTWPVITVIAFISVKRAKKMFFEA